IRDLIVTGVQTCALPIYIVEPAGMGLSFTSLTWMLTGCTGPQPPRSIGEGDTSMKAVEPENTITMSLRTWMDFCALQKAPAAGRSEERRVGKECRGRVGG